MPNDNVKSMIDSLASGDNVKAQDAFKNALSDKIGSALDNKRQSVATDWLGSAKELEAVKDASGLDKVSGAVSTPVGGAETMAVQTPGQEQEPVEIDQGGEENAEPVVPEV
jgi:hypothetical protein|tara:strand:- start:1905 stop:2237 length:333 start_codon:yes stop_codon:yes gene_type:complete